MQNVWQSLIGAKAIIRTVRVACGQLVMTSLTKQFTARQVLFMMKPEKQGITKVASDDIHH